jgi:hypothetical protein
MKVLIPMIKSTAFINNIIEAKRETIRQAEKGKWLASISAYHT